MNSTDADTLKQELPTHLPKGYIYEAEAVDDGLQSTWDWLAKLNRGEQSDTSSSDGVAIIS